MRVCVHQLSDCIKIQYNKNNYDTSDYNNIYVCTFSYVCNEKKLNSLL